MGVNHIMARACRITGVKSTGNPWNGTEYNQGSNAVVDATIPGFSTAGPDRLVLDIVASGANATSSARFSAWTNSSLASPSITENHDQTDTIVGGGGFGCSHGGMASAGTVGSTTVTEAFAGHAYIKVALSAAADATVHTAAASLDAAADIATGGQRDVLRAAAVDGTADITVSAQRDVLRAAEIAATADIVVAGVSVPGGTVHDSSASLDATADIAAAGQRDVLRAAALDATATLEAIGQRDVLRSASLDAVADIIAAGVKIPGAGVHESSASFDATATIATSAQRDVLRTAAFDAVATLEAFGQRDVLRSVNLEMTWNILAAGVNASLPMGAPVLFPQAQLVGPDGKAVGGSGEGKAHFHFHGGGAT
jgi:hypothetical protein